MLHLHLHCISISRYSGHRLLFITLSSWAFPPAPRTSDITSMLLVSISTIDISKHFTGLLQSGLGGWEREGEREEEREMGGGGGMNVRRPKATGIAFALQLTPSSETFPFSPLVFTLRYAVKQKHHFSLGLRILDLKMGL